MTSKRSRNLTRPVSRRQFLLTTAASALAFSIPSELFADSSKMPKRGLCAHRGANATHPENTLPAFEEAIRLGVQMIEFDVKMTRDRALMLMHDETVDRTTDGQGRLADLTLAELLQLDAGKKKDPKFSGTRIPTLDGALAMMPRNVWLNCHIHPKLDPELGPAVARLLQKTKRKHQAFLAANSDVVEAARKIVPDILSCDMDRTLKVEDYVSHCIKSKADFIQLTTQYGIPREAIEELKRHQVRINYTFAETPEDARKLFAAGVDFPLVNDPARFIPLIRELGITPLKPRS